VRQGERAEQRHVGEDHERNQKSKLFGTHFG
jgi:hypothetical protein